MFLYFKDTEEYLQRTVSTDKTKIVILNTYASFLLQKAVDKMDKPTKMRPRASPSTVMDLNASEIKNLVLAKAEECKGTG